MKVRKSEKWLNKTDKQGFPSRLGILHSEETKSKMKKPKSEEHKAKLSAAKKRNSSWTSFRIT